MRTLALALLLIALLIVAALVAVGSRRQPAPPFGPAANGEIIYTNRGDLFAGDPASGETRLLLGGPAVDSGPSYSPDGTSIAFLRTVNCCPEPTTSWHPRRRIGPPQADDFADRGPELCAMGRR